MHVITRKGLNEFAYKYPEAKSGLAHWYQSMKQNNIDGFVELRAILPFRGQSWQTNRIQYRREQGAPNSRDSL